MGALLKVGAGEGARVGACVGAGVGAKVGAGDGNNVGAGGAAKEQGRIWGTTKLKSDNLTAPGGPELSQGARRERGLAQSPQKSRKVEVRDIHGLQTAARRKYRYAAGTSAAKSVLPRAASCMSTSVPLTLRGPRRRGYSGRESGPWRRGYRWRKSWGRSRFRRRHFSWPWGGLRRLRLLTVLASDAQEAEPEVEADQ